MERTDDKAEFIEMFAMKSAEAIIEDKPFVMIVEEKYGVSITGGGLEHDDMLQILVTATLLHLEEGYPHTNEFIDKFTELLKSRRV